MSKKIIEFLCLLLIVGLLGYVIQLFLDIKEDTKNIKTSISSIEKTIEDWDLEE